MHGLKKKNRAQSKKSDNAKLITTPQPPPPPPPNEGEGLYRGTKSSTVFVKDKYRNVKYIKRDYEGWWI